MYLESNIINIRIKQKLSILKEKKMSNCTRKKLNELKVKYGNRYNYMVFNKAQKFSFFPKGVKKRGYNYLCNGRNYRYWVFKSGRFINKGHGGWVNWGFSGNFSRPKENTVVFKRR